MTLPRIQIQVYRTTGSGPPPELQPGELAFSEGDRQVYVGLSDGSIYTLPFVTAAQILAMTRDFATLDNLPTTLSEHNITLQLSDIPTGIDYQTLQNRPDISALDELEDYSSVTTFPATGEAGKLYIALDTGLFYRWSAGQYHQLTGKAAIFGEITGDPDNQANLKAKFDALQAQIDALTLSLLNQRYKVGDIYTTTDATDPATRLGYGTWEVYGSGRVLVGHDSGDPDFQTVGAIGGEKAHVLTAAEMPEHDHDVTLTRNYGAESVLADNSANTSSDAFRGTITTSSAGSGLAHNNLQPYVVVHLWRRTA